MRQKPRNSKPRKLARRPLTLEPLETRLALSGFGMREPGEGPGKAFESPCCLSMSSLEPQVESRSALVGRLNGELGNPPKWAAGRPSDLNNGAQARFGDRPTPARGEGESPVEVPLESPFESPFESPLKPPLDVSLEVSQDLLLDAPLSTSAVLGASLDWNQGAIRIESLFSPLADDLSPMGRSTSSLTAMRLTSGEGWLGMAEDESLTLRTDPFEDGESWWTDEGDVASDVEYDVENDVENDVEKKLERDSGESEVDSDQASFVGDAAASRAARERVRRESGRREAARRTVVRERSPGAAVKQRQSVDAAVNVAVDADGFIALSPGRDDARRAESKRGVRVVERAWVRMGATAARSQSFEVGVVGRSQARGAPAMPWSPDSRGPHRRSNASSPAPQPSPIAIWSR